MLTIQHWRHLLFVSKSRFSFEEKYVCTVVAAK